MTLLPGIQSFWGVHWLLKKKKKKNNSDVEKWEKA